MRNPLRIIVLSIKMLSIKEHITMGVTRQTVWAMALLLVLGASAHGDWSMHQETYSCYKSMTFQEAANGGITVVSHEQPTR